jgi:D-alanyl-D-alanine carboxypeptidase
VIYDLSTETVLYSKNEEVQLPLASLTKILAVVGALSELDPHTLIVITKDDTRGEYSNNLAVGDTFTLSDLARLTLTGSLNDGATAIARMASSKVEGNVPRMLGNVSAALNLSETYAVNGNGLDVSGYVSGGYGSALDMAKLSGALVRLAPDIAAATSQTSVKATTKDGKVYTISNTNPKVHTIPGILFSKTGYTSLAGGNLSLVIDVGIDHPVAIVVLGSTEKGRFQDSDTLLKATFSHFADLESL